MTLDDVVSYSSLKLPVITTMPSSITRPGCQMPSIWSLTTLADDIMSVLYIELCCDLCLGQGLGGTCDQYVGLEIKTASEKQWT